MRRPRQKETVLKSRLQRAAAISFGLKPNSLGISLMLTARQSEQGRGTLWEPP
jgi:hypothetical protein